MKPDWALKILIYACVLMMFANIAEMVWLSISIKQLERAARNPRPLACADQPKTGPCWGMIHNEWVSGTSAELKAQGIHFICDHGD